MRYMTALLSAGFVVSAVSIAVAETGKEYQKRLLGRDMLRGDVTFCKAVVGKRTDSNKSRYDKCHVTRNYLVDSSNGPASPFPPMAHEDYAANQNEYNTILAGKRN